MYKVTIKETGKTVQIDEDTNLLMALRENGEYIKSSCGGVASCSDCLCKVTMGTDNLNAPSFEELKLLGNVFHITKERLACQVMVSGDIEIDLSMHDQASDQEVLRKKSSSFKKPSVNTRVRKKNEVEEVMSERNEKREEKKVKDDSWFKHWEKGEDQMKRLGGGKRPKEFRTEDPVYGEDGFPIDPEPTPKKK